MRSTTLNDVAESGAVPNTSRKWQLVIETIRVKINNKLQEFFFVKIRNDAIMSDIIATARNHPTRSSYISLCSSR